MATKITGTNTAAAPGVTGDDTDTGLFYGTNEIGFSTGGTSRATIDSSGRLLLGTTTAGFAAYGDALTIEDSNHVGLTLRTATNKDSAIYFADSSSGGGRYAGGINYNHSNNYLNFTTNESERLRIDSSGNVGIGTTSPTNKLQVNDTNPVIAEFYHSDGGTNDEARIALGAYSSNPPSQRGITLVGKNNGAGHDFIVNTSSSHSLGPTEKLRITSAGNVGIGITSPGEKLSVNGKVEVRGGNWFVARSGDNSNYAYIKNPETSGAALGLYTSGEKVRVDSAGKVYVNRTTALDSNYVNFSATKALSAGIPQNQINIGDAAAYNTTDNGGAIGFSAIYSSGGAYTTMASIEGVKTNNTDGNYNGDMVFKTRSHNGNNVTRMRLTDAGLCFGTDTAAVNALSDYEEGTFTPTAVNSSATITNTNSCYTKIGRLVIATYHINFSNTNGNAAQVSLPITAGGKHNSAVGGMVTEHNVGSTSIAACVDSTTVCRFLQRGQGGTAYTADNFNGKTLRFSVWYMTE